MFKKIISELPFNPGLVYQLRFYSNRLKEENSIRRLGMIFTVLAMGVQMLAILVPAKTSLATSANDIIYGASSKNSVINSLNTGRDNYGREDIKEIYNYFGISIKDIENSTLTEIRSQERNYISTGRSHSEGVDVPVSIPGTSTIIYERSLSVWDTGGYENCYRVLTGTASSGKLNGRNFWIILGSCGSTEGGCGNIVFEALPNVAKPEIYKEAVVDVELKPNNTFVYRVNFRNNGNAPLTGVIIKDTLAAEYELVEQYSPVANTFSSNGQELTWNFRDIEPSPSWHELAIRVKIKQISEAKKTVCNSATLYSSNGGEVSTVNDESARCINIDNSCPGTDLPAPDGNKDKCKVICVDGSTVLYTRKNDCPKPVAACESLKVTSKPSWNQRKFEVSFNLSRGAALTDAELLINNKVVKNFGAISKTGVFDYTHTFANQGGNSITVKAKPKNETQYISGLSCTITENITQPLSIINYQKSASNKTQDIQDFNNKTARAGDEIEYTLTINNRGNIEAKDYVIDSDNLNDVLEYADITSYGDAYYDKINRRLTWPPQTIPANNSIAKKFIVKVKSPIPTTPPSLSDKTSFNYRMTNTFGNTVSIDVDKPVAGAIYQSVNQLPNTGPSPSLLISVFAFIVIGYFYARSRLLVKEVEIIRNELSAEV